MKIGLRGRILCLVLGLLGINLVGALLTLLYAHTVYRIYSDTLMRSVNMLILAEKMETALVMQKGYVTYFFVSSDSQWLGRLEKFHEDFTRYLEESLRVSADKESSRILNEIRMAYKDFTRGRDKVISMYREGRIAEAVELHWSVRDKFHQIYNLAEEFKQFYEKRIMEVSESYKGETRFVTISAMVAVPFSLVVALILGWILIKQVLNPVLFLAHTLSRGDIMQEEFSPSPDEITELRRKVEKLLEVMDTAENALRESREHLIQSEKMALVGRLAAGVAHSILNPLTSVKMRLYSLERTLQLSPSQQEDFEVFSEEIRHIETILRNFLEFSRPPKPVLQSVSLSDVVDMAIQLLRHRLESYNVNIVIKRDGRLPKIQADPDQIKEVLVNLILNACEAMGEGGTIEIEETEGVMEPEGRVVIIKVKDTGPGIPPEIADRIFEPFFTTKEDGSGLGLSIAKRIVEDHGGWIHCTSQEGQGATFVIALPCRESEKWLRSW